MYKDLVKEFPKARYIFLIRDPEKWYDSLERMITKFDNNLKTALDSFHQKGRYGFVSFFKNTIDVDILYNNKEKIISYFEDYNQTVKKFFKKSKYDFLEMNITQGDGWDKLCEFLNKEKPDINFPHENRGDSLIVDRNYFKFKIKSKIKKILKFLKKNKEIK